VNRRLFGVAAVLLAAGIAGRGAPRPPPVPFEGAVVADATGLELGAGALLKLPVGTELSAIVDGSVDLGFGPPEDAFVTARAVQGSVHLVDHAGEIVGNAKGAPYRAGDAVWVTCSSPLRAGAGRAIMQGGAPVGRCDRSPSAWIRALGPAHVRSVQVDRAPVNLAPKPFRTDAALLTLVIGGLLGEWLGFAALLPLLLAPLALLLPLPALATLAVLAGAAGMVRRGSRGYAVAGVALVIAMGVVLDEVRRGFALRSEPGAVAEVLAPTVTAALFEEKVSQIVQARRDAVQAATHPLVLALGGSSSGGGTEGRFWPQVVQEELGARASVVSLAWGGATTWHLRRALDDLDIHAQIARVCVLYVGHNDVVAAVPGRSIAEVIAGAPAGVGMMPPVRLPEAAQNIAAIRDRCGHTLAIQERVRGGPDDMVAYAAMIQQVPGVDWADGSALVADADLLDDVHIAPAGHERFGKAIAARIAGWLAEP
jgi:lysophospholipase L1-like esterase